jgi:2-polyprenyl-6-methoxyphenol hydroxylase-like FAD-dependent oxidoreductase
VKLNTIELTLEVGTEQFMNPELFIAGGGPAGFATAIVAARSGLSVVVSDTGHPPIDKAYGEGLLPDSLEALSQLGVDLSFVRSFPVHGVRFVGTGSNPTGLVSSWRWLRHPVHRSSLSPSPSC